MLGVQTYNLEGLDFEFDNFKSLYLRSFRIYGDPGVVAFGLSSSGSFLMLGGAWGWWWAEFGLHTLATCCVSVCLCVFANSLCVLKIFL